MSAATQTPDGRTLETHAKEVYGGSGGLSIRGGDSPSIDAFARLRVSDITGLFDNQLQYDESPLFWETSPATGTFATHLADEATIRMRVTGGQTVIRQTRAYHRYQPGKSQFVLMTFVCNAPVVGVYQRIGYFDSENGIFFQINDNDGTLNFVRRSYVSGAAVDETVSQVDWNLDPMDGSGPSGVTLHITQSQILVIDLEWLGVGRVRIGFVIDGVPIYCHQFLCANINNTVYMTTANLPLRYEISAAAGLVGNYDLMQICNQVASEGGFEEERGVPFSKSNGADTISVTTRRPILSIRPSATFNSIVNRGQIAPEELSVFSDDQDAYWELVYGCAVSGSAFAPVDVNYSIAEWDVTGTSVWGGITIASGYAPAGGGLPGRQISGSAAKTILSKLPLALDIAGNHPTTPLTDILSLVVTSIPGDATDTSGEITWRELR